MYRSRDKRKQSESPGVVMASGVFSARRRNRIERVSAEKIGRETVREGAITKNGSESFPVHRRGAAAGLCRVHGAAAAACGQQQRGGRCTGTGHPGAGDPALPRCDPPPLPQRLGTARRLRVAAGQLVPGAAGVSGGKRRPARRKAPAGERGGPDASGTLQRSVALRAGKSGRSALPPVSGRFSVHHGAAAGGAGALSRLPQGRLSAGDRGRVPQAALQRGSGGERPRAGGALWYAAPFFSDGSGRAAGTGRCDRCDPVRGPDGRLSAHGPGEPAGVSAPRGEACPKGRGGGARLCPASDPDREGGKPPCGRLSL